VPRRPRILPILILFSLIVSSGCGYRLAGYRAPDADESAATAAPRITVVTLVNESREPGIEVMASEAVRREVLHRGGMRLDSNPERADYVLRGRVLPLYTTSRTFSGVVRSLENRVTLRLAVDIVGKDGSSLPVPSEELTATELYLSSADLEVGRKNRTEALRRICTVLAQRLHDEVDRELLGALQ
jgi:hypothetical protein